MQRMRSIERAVMWLAFALAWAIMDPPAVRASEEPASSYSVPVKSENGLASASAAELVPLKVALPKCPMMAGPERIPQKYPIIAWKAPMVPMDVKLLSLNKPVTASDMAPIIGELSQLTDGDKESSDGSFVELGPGRQWVQVDLGASFDVYAIILWHDYFAWNPYFDVIVRCADDGKFTKTVKTLFNNDRDNSSGLGKGRDAEYMEWFRGNLIDCQARLGKPVRTRYARCYSNGSLFEKRNRFVEVEVYGRAVKAK